MKRFARILPLAAAFVAESVGAQQTATPTQFTARDVFALEWVSDPQISPDGRRVIFVRAAYDSIKDSKRSNLWIANSDGSDVRPLLAGDRQASSPRWSPDGRRILFASSVGGHTELVVRDLESGHETPFSTRADSWGGISWSPDGRWIAFTMLVPQEQTSPARMITPPHGANWGPPLRYIEKLNYRVDGEGYPPPGYRHIFIVRATGGTPRQVTDGSFDDGAPVWTPDGKSLLFSANRTADAEYNPFESEIYEVTLATGAITQLTHRKGPDSSPSVSPNGKLIACS
jgi:acylaminoacyl-peptidase